MMRMGSALRYNLGGREVIAEEFPMASPHAFVVMEKCHKSYLQPSKGDDQFERLQCITDDGRRNGTTCTTVTSQKSSRACDNFCLDYTQLNMGDSENSRH